MTWHIHSQITQVALWVPSAIGVFIVLFMTIRTSTLGSGEPTAPVNKSSRNTHTRHTWVKREDGLHQATSAQDFYHSESAPFQDGFNLCLQSITGHQMVFWAKNFKPKVIRLSNHKIAHIDSNRDFLGKCLIPTSSKLQVDSYKQIPVSDLGQDIVIHHVYWLLKTALNCSIHGMKSPWFSSSFPCPVHKYDHPCCWEGCVAPPKPFCLFPRFKSKGCVGTPIKVYSVRITYYYTISQTTDLPMKSRSGPN